MKSLNHLINALKKYEITTNMEVHLCIGVTLDWNCTKAEANCSMPGYLPRLLHRLMHIPPSKPQDSPQSAPQVKCGNKIQLAVEEDNLPILEKDRVALTQSIVGAAL